MYTITVRLPKPSVFLILPMVNLFRKVIMVSLDENMLVKKIQEGEDIY
jgi:hypothetical protein